MYLDKISKKNKSPIILQQPQSIFEGAKYFVGYIKFPSLASSIINGLLIFKSGIRFYMCAV